MTSTRAAELLAAAALLALATAFTLQYGLGFAPCHLCVLERWPWAAVAASAATGLVLGRTRIAAALALVALVAGTGMSAYHVSVEQGWIALPSSCVAGGSATSIDELRAQLSSAAPTCDQVSAAFLGLSLAAWNGIASLAAAGIAFAGLRGPQAA